MFYPNEHLINLKGKDYLQVMWRLVWFRDEHPDWCIDTKLEDLTEKGAVFSCKIYDGNGVQKASGWGSETQFDFRDYLEKAETKSIGRALAMLGYGTQFAPELDEGERIVDSPVQRKSVEYRCSECGAVITPAKAKNGKTVTIDQHIDRCLEVFGTPLCCDCIERAKQNEGKNK